MVVVVVDVAAAADSLARKRGLDRNVPYSKDTGILETSPMRSLDEVQRVRK